jgi:trehalose 6-phosphate phosphatase
MPPDPDPLAVVRSAGRDGGVFVDFDGTLSAIVEDPLAARPLPGALDVLRSLVARFGLVAVVSGRPVAFLREHIAVERVVLSGLYGLELWRDGAVVVQPEALAWRPVAARVADRAAAELPAGVGIERKGLSVGLHVRAHPDLEEAVRSWAEQMAAETGLALHPARRSFELRPPLDIDKGTAVVSLSAGLSALCFVGDDRGDLAAFGALDQLSRAGVATVRVVASSPETPPEVLAAADVVVVGPEGALALLASLSPTDP